ncbi:NLR family CARD domain-containing protein 3-like [Ambystoma mexicanum]|uniref:NLR family CARD domain-containing protein 3-like n=1 Tax=Ambystoma mexicanum TaxID=8296 RepID=UPI0037E7A7AC
MLNRTVKIQGQMEDASCCSHILIRYIDLFVTNDDLSQSMKEHEYFSLANRRARIYEHNEFQRIKLEELLTAFPSENERPRTVFISGIAGIGKSVAMQRLLSEWALGVALKDYLCVMDFAFRELNVLENNVTFDSLVQSKHPHLQKIFQELSNNPKDLLFILDGLDEFKYPLYLTDKPSSKRIDQPAHVSELISSLISGALLSGASIIITARPSVDITTEIFDRKIVILGFEEQQVQQYCLRFYGDKNMAQEVFEYITKNDNLSGLAFIPLYCFIICTALQAFFTHGRDSSFCEATPSTMTEVYCYYLCTIMNVHMSKESSETLDAATGHRKLRNPDVLRAMKGVICQLGKLAYYTLLNSKIIFYRKDLQDFGFDLKNLPSSFLNKIFVRIKDHEEVEMFSFFHMTVQEHLAALYCVMAMPARPHDLIQSLNLWCFGIIPEEPNNNEIISSTIDILKNNRSENLQMFARFFLGLLSARIERKLDGLTEDMSRDILQPLTEWFQEKVKYQVNQKLLNLLHCLRELKQEEVVAKVAPGIDEVNLFKVTLNPVDCTCLFDVLQHSTNTLKILNLGYANIGMKGFKRLTPLFHRCETLHLRYNSLDKEAAFVESLVLKSTDCKVKCLLMCGNCIGPDGVRSIWDALQVNSTLEELYMDITGITDSGLDNMLHCLAKNTTLRILTIVGNKLGEDGKQKLIALHQQKPTLKIISTFVDDMGLLQAYLDWVEEIKADPEQMESVRNADALRSVLWELKQTPSKNKPEDMRERLEKLQQEITKLLQLLGLAEGRKG